jgi:hypothetical protein
MSKPQKSFTICIEAEVQMSIEDIWPDDDAPENPTAKDVIQAMQDDCISIGRLVEDWNIPVSASVWNQNDRNDRASWD